jgi:gluconokinase
MPFVFYILSEISCMSDYFIGVDVGTGSTKALAVDTNGKVLSSAQFAYPTAYPDEQRCEQDPEAIWLAFAKCISQLVKTLQRNPRGISLSTAMHSLILMDIHDRALAPMITWADNRAGKIAEKLRASASGEMLYEQNGTPIHAMAPLCKIIWLRENEHGIFSQVKKFISIKEFIWFKLFGVYECDHSIASATALMNIETLQWNENALTVAGISSQQLSQLVDTDFMRQGVQHAAALQLGISENTFVIIGSSDGCMANLGSFATEPGIGALTIGTSGAVRVASKKPVFNFAAMTFNYRLDREMFICGGPSNNGGIVLKWYAEKILKKKLESSKDYDELLSKLGSAETESDGLIFLPFIQGERAPIWNSDACGVFFGIRSHHAQKHFTRAVIEGVSMALYHIAENMEKCGLKIEQINASGGFIHSNSWLQILANIFGKKVCLINTGDASAMGAAYLGMKKTGMINSYAEMRKEESKVIMPEQHRFAGYQIQYKRYQKLYESLSAIMGDH